MRKASREVAVAARSRSRGGRANVEDLAAYSSAKQRADAVHDWLHEKVGLLVQEAALRRSEQRRECGVAPASMRDHGESQREIAHMAGTGEKTVRERIRSAAQDDAAAEQTKPALSVDCGGSSSPSHSKRCARRPWFSIGTSYVKG